MNTLLDVPYAKKCITTTWNDLAVKYNDYNTQQLHERGIDDGWT